VAVMTILIVGQQGYTGGINGITDLRTLLGWDIRTDHAKFVLYFVCSGLLLASMVLARAVIRSKLGRILLHWSRRDRLGEFRSPSGLVLKLRTEAGDEVLLPLSERSAKQVQMVIGEFNRGRDFLVVED
jgi:hypothetical protein